MKKVLMILLLTVVGIGCGGPVHSSGVSDNGQRDAGGVDSGEGDQQDPGDGGEQDPIGSPIGFAEVRENVIAKGNCLMCHSGNTPAAGIKLSDYETIMAQPGLVVAGDPENSRMYQAVKSGRMPKFGGPLPKESVDLLEQWIVEGAVDTVAQAE